MPRTYKSKNIQSKKELSGKQNLSTEYINSHKDDKAPDGLMENLSEMFSIGIEQKKKGCNWKVEDLTEAIQNYFAFCGERRLKPSKSGLILWLGLSSSQYHAWQTEPHRYGGISEIVIMANYVIENQYINKLESYPTGNIFLLKAGHGYAETQNVNVTAQNVSAEDVAESIKKLGL